MDIREERENTHTHTLTHTGCLLSEISASRLHLVPMAAHREKLRGAKKKKKKEDVSKPSKMRKRGRRKRQKLEMSLH